MKKYRVFYSYFSDDSIRHFIDCRNFAFLQSVIFALLENDDLVSLNVVVLND